MGKEQIKCKYMFQDKEKFDGKPYCTCFNELCEDISIICDHNCQIYEDYKQLARKTQECEELKEKLHQIEDVVKPINEQLPEDSVIRQIMLILNDCNKLEPSRYRKALEEIEKICLQDRAIKDVCLVSTCFKRDRVVYDIQEEILYIINKAKGERNAV